jgi:hypothetical protein
MIESNMHVMCLIQFITWSFTCCSIEWAVDRGNEWAIGDVSYFKVQSVMCNTSGCRDQLSPGLKWSGLL